MFNVLQKQNLRRTFLDYITSSSIFQVDDCNTGFGCIRMPANCIGTNCPVLITYRNTQGIPGYIDIEMQTNQLYIALGHNIAPQMVSMIFYPKHTFTSLLIMSTVTDLGSIHKVIALEILDLILHIF